MKLLVLLSLLIGSVSFAQKVPIYDSAEVILKLSNGRAMQLLMKPGAQFSGYFLHIYESYPLHNRLNVFNCGKVLARERKGYDFILKLVCVEMKGKFVSQDAVQLDIHGKINKDLRADGYLYFGRMVSRFEAFDPSTVK